VREVPADVIYARLPEGAREYARLAGLAYLVEMSHAAGPLAALRIWAQMGRPLQRQTRTIVSKGDTFMPFPFTIGGIDDKMLQLVVHGSFNAKASSLGHFFKAVVWITPLNQFDKRMPAFEGPFKMVFVGDGAEVKSAKGKADA
jgi:hypothetical protein